MPNRTHKAILTLRKESTLQCKGVVLHIVEKTTRKWQY